MLNITEHLWTSIKLCDCIWGGKSGHICRGKWPMFLSLRFKWYWPLEIQNNALWWHCLDRSGVIKLLQCRNFCAMSKQRWYCFGTLHLTQCATFITNVKSSVRHSQFLWGESIETKLVCRNNNNCDLRGLANFERATYLNLLILIRIGHTNFHFWVYYLAFLLYVDIGKSL